MEQIKSPDEIIREGKSFLRDNPESGQVHRQLSQAYQQKARGENTPAFFTLAFESAKESVRLLPQDTDCHNNFISVSSQAGKIDEAVQIYKKIITKYPDSEILKKYLKQATTIAQLSLPVSSASQQQQMGFWSKILGALLIVSLILFGIFKQGETRYFLLGLALFFLYYLYHYSSTREVKKSDNW